MKDTENKSGLLMKNMVNYDIIKLNCCLPVSMISMGGWES